MQTANMSEAGAYFSGKSLQIDAEFCVNLRSRMDLCSDCSDHCPHDALQLSCDEIQLDKDLCTGCGGCLPHCKAGALLLSGFASRRFLEAIDEIDGEEPLDLHCRESREKGGGIVIPCHLILNTSLLMAVAAKGCSEVRLHGLVGCSACKGRSAITSVVALKKELSEKVEDGFLQLDLNPSHAGKGVKQREDQPQLSRRGFLRMAGSRSVTAGLGYLIPTVEAEDLLDELPFYQNDALPQRPSILHTLLAEAQPDIDWRSGVEQPWRQREFSAACSACMSCSERCPTGALQGESKPNYRRIIYRMDRCSDCGLCEAICPEDAIRSTAIEGKDGFTDIAVTLIYQQQQACERCGDPFVNLQHETLCPICSNEAEIENEWMAMLGSG